MATIHQELAASRDVLRILENYKKHAGPDFAGELDVLTADMRSSSYEAALIRFEARMGSAIISDIVRGLVGILRGDDGRMYFQMLSHDLKALELQRLKAKAAKIPPKIRVGTGLSRTDAAFQHRSLLSGPRYPTGDADVG